MGVIKRQSIKNSLINYVGVFIGALSTVFVYPNATESYGAIRFLVDTALLIVPFVLFGATGIVVKFFPQFRDEEAGHHGFLFNLLALSSVGLVLLMLLYLVFQDSLLHLYEASPLIQEHLWYILPFTIFLAFFTLLSQYTSNFQRIVVPDLLKQLQKFTLPALILLFLWNTISFSQLVQFYSLHFLVVLILLVLYIARLGQLHLRPDFSFLTRPLLKEMGTFGFYGMLGFMGTVVVTRIDSTMIGTLLGEQSTGVYGILMFMGNVIEIPTIAIMKITGPIISDAWNANDLGKIKDLYKRSSLNLLIGGVFLFLGIWICLEDLLNFMPNGDVLRPAKNIVLFIGLTRIVDMATSINNQVIGYSKYFRFNFYAILVMAVLNILFNLWFIPLYGVVGAALATFCSISIYNFFKTTYVWYRFRMIPFSSGTIWLIGIGLGMLLLFSFIPPFEHPLLGIFVKGSLVTLIFGALVLGLRISPDVNAMVFGILGRFWPGPKGS